MANRLTRNQVCNRALDLLDSPRLNEIDGRGNPPDRTFALGDTALTVGWLQDALDLAVNLYPLSGNLTSTTVNFVTGTTSYALPSDYIIDYPHGIVIEADGIQQAQMFRRGFNFLLKLRTDSQSRRRPAFYCARNSLLEIRPAPDIAYTGTLYYYALPAVLEANTIPTFPSDFMLVEYVKMRGLEWLRELPPDSANKYLQATMAQLVKAGLGQEAESDQIDVDPVNFPGDPGFTDQTAWMGQSVIS